MTVPITRLGTIDTTGAAITSLRLDNDGVHLDWLTPGDTYRLRHDGAHWQVTGGSWFEPGHVYRLTRSGYPITALPTDDLGDVRLAPGTEYVISADGAGWALSRWD